MATCPECGWWEKVCKCSPDGHTVGVITHEWIKKGTWEHIDPKNPNMRIESKAQLMRECQKRGLIPRAFMKPRSLSGKGVEYAK